MWCCISGICYFQHKLRSRCPVLKLSCTARMRVCVLYSCWCVRCWVTLLVPFCQDVSAPSLPFLFYPSSPLRSLFFHSVLQLSPFQVGPASFEFLIFLFSMLWALQTIFNCTGIGPHISKAVHLKALQLKPNLCTTSGTKWDFFFLVILVNWSFRVLLYCCSSQGAIHVVLYLGSVPGHGKQN